MSLRAHIAEQGRKPIRSYFSCVPGAHILYVVPPACCRCRWFSHELFGGPGDISFLYLDDTDIAMGCFDSQIADALESILPHLKSRPKAVQLCITCAFEILGVDYDDLVFGLENRFEDIRFSVFPIHHLTTSTGILAPENRELALYTALRDPLPTDPHAVNIVDATISLDDDSEIWNALRACGITTVRQPMLMNSYDEFCLMAASCLNIQIGRMGGPACDHMEKTLGIPSMRVPETYSARRVQKSLEGLCERFGCKAPDIEERVRRCEELGRQTAELFNGAPLFVAESNSIDSIDLALALHEYGFNVAVVCSYFARETDSAQCAQLKETVEGIRIVDLHKEERLKLPEGTIVLGRKSSALEGEYRYFKARTHGEPYGLSRIEHYLEDLASYAREELM